MRTIEENEKVMILMEALDKEAPIKWNHVAPYVRAIKRGLQEIKEKEEGGNDDRRRESEDDT